jgi:hypothetical protein
MNVVDAHQRVQGMLPRHQIKGNIHTLCNLVRPLLLLCLCMPVRSLKAAGVCIGLLILIPAQPVVSLLVYSVYSALPFITQGWIHRNVVACFTGLRYASQNGQDLYLHDRFFRGRTRPGVFVEFGMSNDITNINTYFLETQLTWRGLCVEPVLADYQHATVTRPGPGCRVVRAAVLPACPAPSGDISIPASLGRATIAHNPRGRAKGKEHRDGRMHHHPSPDGCWSRPASGISSLVSIDTEGTELAIMTTFPWHDFVISMVQVEVITTTPGLPHAMTRFMQGAGYELDAVLDITSSMFTVDVVDATCNAGFCHGVSTMCPSVT